MITDAEINEVLARVDALLDECFPYRERQAALAVKPIAAVAAAPVVKRDDDQGFYVKAHVEPAKRPPGGIRLHVPDCKLPPRAYAAKVLDEIAF